MKKNARSLDAIAVAYNALERASIIDAGDLLIEAKDQCDHGKWLDWVERELDCSITTAERRMRVAELAAKFPKLRNLKIGKGTLFELVGEDREDLPAIVTELAKHATKSRLPSGDAKRVIRIGIGRRRFGDYPDVTLERLSTLSDDSPRHAKLIAALKDQKPTTDEAADAIVIDIRRKHVAEVEAQAEAEAEAKEADKVLDGEPPVLPQSPPLGDQRLSHGDMPDVDADDFADAVRELSRLSTKPARKLAGVVPEDDLRNACKLIEAVLIVVRAAPADA